MAEDTGSNTALVVLVVVLIAVLLGVIFFWWGRGEDADAELKVEIREPGSGSLIVPAPSLAVAPPPDGLRLAGMA